MKKHLFYLAVIGVLISMDSAVQSKSYCCCDNDKMKSGPIGGQCIGGDSQMCTTTPNHPFPVHSASYCVGVTRHGDCEADKKKYGNCCYKVSIIKGKWVCID